MKVYLLASILSLALVTFVHLNLEISKVKKVANYSSERTKNTANKGETPLLKIVPSDNCTKLDSFEVLLDEKNPLPQNFVPDDLVTLSSKVIPGPANAKLRAEAADQLYILLWEMRKLDLAFKVYSAYRSPDNQKAVYVRSVNDLETSVLGSRIAAPPGHSEHQLGTAVDLVLPNGQQLYPSKVWDWLDQNAHKFGFVMSYRFPHQELTGYKFEPWHWRYVGISLARKIRYSPDPPQKFYKKIAC